MSTNVMGLVSKSKLVAIANAIRARTGAVGPLTLGEMPSAIADILVPSGSIEISTNGTHDVTNYEDAIVNVPSQATGTIQITANGTVDVSSYASANVEVRSGVENWEVITGTITTSSSGKPLTITNSNLIGKTLLVTTGYVHDDDLTALPDPTTDSKTEQLAGWFFINSAAFPGANTVNGQWLRRYSGGSNGYYQGGTAIGLNSTTGVLTINNTKAETWIMAGVTYKYCIVVKGS